MRVRRCCDIQATVSADDDDTDADQVWKDSSANEDGKQQPAGATSDEASLLADIPTKHFLLPPRDADTMQVPPPPLDP